MDAAAGAIDTARGKRFGLGKIIKMHLRQCLEVLVARAQHVEGLTMVTEIEAQSGLSGFDLRQQMCKNAAE